MLTLKDEKKEIYQWDSGIKLRVSSNCNEVHFSNVLYGDAITVIVKNNEVEIPNEFLTKAEPFFCWGYISDEGGGYTIAQKRFDIRKRPKPVGYVYTPSEKVTVEQVAKEAVEKALQSGIKGDKVYIRYSAYADGTDFTEEWNKGQDYIGISITKNEAPTDKSEYTWSMFAFTGEGKKEITDYIDKEIAEFDFVKVVDELPEEGLPNREYFVRKDSPDTNDLFDEYAWINIGTEEEPNWAWEFKGTKTMEIDLSDYVKRTDFFSNTKPGIVSNSSYYGFRAVDEKGSAAGISRTLEQYKEAPAYYFISKGTLENILYDYVRRGITKNPQELTDEEKDDVCAWIGAKRADQVI